MRIERLSKNTRQGEGERFHRHDLVDPMTGTTQATKFTQASADIYRILRYHDLSFKHGERTCLSFANIRRVHRAYCRLQQSRADHVASMMNRHYSTCAEAVAGRSGFCTIDCVRASCIPLSKPSSAMICTYKSDLGTTSTSVLARPVIIHAQQVVAQSAPHACR